MFQLYNVVQSIKIAKRSRNAAFVNLGETLVLNVTYEYSGIGGVGVQWRNKNGKVLIERYRIGGADNIIDSRASFAGKATLVLTLHYMIMEYTELELILRIVMQRQKHLKLSFEVGTVHR